MVKVNVPLPNGPEESEIDSVFARAVSALSLPLSASGTGEVLAHAIRDAESALPAARDEATRAAAAASRPFATIAEANAARTAADGAAFTVSRLDSLLADLRVRAAGVAREGERLSAADEHRAAAAERDALVAEAPAIAAAIDLLVDYATRHQANSVRIAQANRTDTGFDYLLPAECILRGIAENDTSTPRLHGMRLPRMDGPGLAWPVSSVSMLAPVRPQADELAAHPLRLISRPGAAITVSIFNGSMKVGPVAEGGRPSEARMSDAQVAAARAAGCSVQDIPAA